MLLGFICRGEHLHGIKNFGLIEELNFTKTVTKISTSTSQFGDSGTDRVKDTRLKNYVTREYITTCLPMPVYRCQNTGTCVWGTTYDGGFGFIAICDPHLAAVEKPVVTAVPRHC